MRYKNRKEAGKVLAEILADYVNRDDVFIFALPRGGVPIAAEIADALHLPLDVLLVRKLGVPGQEELAMGAISVGELCVLNEGIIAQLRLGEADIEKVLHREKAELDRRNQLYRDNRPMPDLSDKTVIIVDDGLATGATMRAAISALKKAYAGKIVVAVPVGATDTCAEIEHQVDEFICPSRPDPFRGVGAWYDDFTQVTDAEVIALLHQFGGRLDGPAQGDGIKVSRTEGRPS
ncbi:MAG: phosphoribosyltransferase [Sneathiella sp.]|nr:phosphoribosyltransferase [Sneathiella sp.]